MGRMEVITRTQRQRTYSEAEKAAVVAKASVLGDGARGVATAQPNVVSQRLRKSTPEMARSADFYCDDAERLLAQIGLELRPRYRSPR